MGGSKSKQNELEDEEGKEVTISLKDLPDPDRVLASMPSQESASIRIGRFGGSAVEEAAKSAKKVMEELGRQGCR